MASKIANIKNYFTDESGDPYIFDSKGRVIVGETGCSRFFILGFLDVENPKELRSDLEELRNDLLDDPYFKDIPSMQPEAQKTAMAFHAKDDIKEVRREVYKLLRSKRSLRFIAVIKDKLKVVQYAISRISKDKTYLYNANELYDLLTRRIFKNYLHLAKKYKICYAIRGNNPRTKAFGDSLKTAQERFMNEYDIASASILSIKPEYSKNEPCLQATDYFLWALQRLYEKREDRYFEYMKDFYKLVIDIDDTRCKQYGEYYSNKENQLSLNSIKPLI